MIDLQTSYVYIITMNDMIYNNLKNTLRLKSNLADEIERELGIRIVSGTYQCDEFLDNEESLAIRFQVSKAVIHESIKSLVLKGLVEARRGIGIRVRERSQWKLLDDDVLSWMLVAPPSVDLLRQLMDIRLCFEPNLSCWVAERVEQVEQAELAAIDKAYNELSKEHLNYENLLIACALFHKAVLKATHNEFLNVIEGVIYYALLLKRQIVKPQTVLNDDFLACYNGIYHSISQGDGDLAKQFSIALLKLEILQLDEK